MPAQGLNVGVLASDKQKLNQLVLLIKSTGEQVGAALEVASCEDTLPSVDVWVVDVDSDDGAGHSLIERIDAANIPLVYSDNDDNVKKDKASKGDGVNEHVLLPHQIRQARAQKLHLKLKSSVLNFRKSKTPAPAVRAKYVWVLAASTGGPEAVARFLTLIPDSLVNVAFIYVQHIEESAKDTLRQVVEQNSSWRVCDTDHSALIVEKSIFIVSPQHQIELLDNGVIAGTNAPWKGDYSPSIDQVIAKVARVYRWCGGAIIFTGMGNDGAFGCNMLAHRGGKVWIQSPESCAVDSMPLSVKQKGCAGKIGTPEELAKQFCKAYGR